MPVNVIIGALLVAAAVPVLLSSVAAARPARRSQLLAGSSKADLREVALTESAVTRVLVPWTRGLLDKLRRITPVGRVEALDRQLVYAGLAGRLPVERILGFKVLAGVAGFGLGTVLTNQGLLLPAVVAALGFFAPDTFVRGRAQERQLEIQNTLADTLDQITMSVEAGLGFEGAIARTARAGEGPLASELTRTLQEMQVGVSRSEALRNLADRTSVADLRSFVTAIVQAEDYGLPIAQVLRVQASEMRIKRRQRAEERALKMPVKIIFPLVFCIFPTLFIVLLGPAAIRLYENVIR